MCVALLADVHLPGRNCSYFLLDKHQKWQVKNGSQVVTLVNFFIEK